MDQTTMKPKTSAKDFFLYIAVMIAFYVSVGTFLSLVFDIINRAFPDALYGSYDFYSASVRMSVAVIVILFPTYLGLSWFAGKELLANPEKRELGIRRFFLFFTLFLAGATFLVDLIVLLNGFLGGEIGTRFVLKALTVLLVASLVFFYYLYDIRKGENKNPKVVLGARITSSVLVLAALIGGFIIAGSPMTVRQMRFDDTRISDLNAIQYQIINYWQAHGALPKQLTLLEDSISGFKVPVDPETSEAYAYQTSDVNSFKLCATFNLPTAQNSTAKYYGGMMGENWNHQAGNTCFDRTIDPALYPPTPKRGY